MNEGRLLLTSMIIISYKITYKYVLTLIGTLTSLVRFPVRTRTRTNRTGADEADEERRLSFPAPSFVPPLLAAFVRHSDRVLVVRCVRADSAGTGVVYVTVACLRPCHSRLQRGITLASVCYFSRGRSQRHGVKRGRCSDRVVTVAAAPAYPITAT